MILLFCFFFPIHTYRRKLIACHFLAPPPSLLLPHPTIRSFSRKGEAQAGSPTTAHPPVHSQPPCIHTLKTVHHLPVESGSKLDRRRSCTSRKMLPRSTYSSFQSIIRFVPIVKKQVIDALQLYCPCLRLHRSPLCAHVWRRYGQRGLGEAGRLKS